MRSIGRILVTMLTLGVISTTLGCDVSTADLLAGLTAEDELSQSAATPILVNAHSQATSPEVVAGDPTLEDTSEERLRIEKHTEEYMLVINPSATPFPLAEFRLANERGEIDGGDWGFDELYRGECIVIWKQKGNTQPPDDPGCQTVADIPVGTPVFWGKSIDLYYAGEHFGTCGEYENPCLIFAEG